MKNTLFKISDEVAKKIHDHFATVDFQDIIKELKSVKDTGTFRMVISTDNIDRHGEVVLQSGWQTENYMKNPVVLWGHEHYSIPIGITDRLITETAGGYTATIAEGRFASHEFAQTLRKLYDEKMLNTSSVGFIPLEYNGNQITKAELLEWSFVSIPANPFAVDARSLGLSIPELVAKGIFEKRNGEIIKTEQEIDEDKEPKADDLETPDDEEEVIEDDAETVQADDEVKEGNLSDEELSITLNDGSVKTFKLSKDFIFKAGRVLSKSNRDKITNAISALEEVIKADTEEEVQNDNGTEGTATKEIQEAEDFLKLRKGVQGIATALSDILASARVDAEKHF